MDNKDNIRYLDNQNFDNLTIEECARMLCNLSAHWDKPVGCYFRSILCVIYPGADPNELVHNFNDIVANHHTYTFKVAYGHTKRENGESD